MTFDLINIPIKPTTPIYKHNNNYCFRISEEIDAKLLTSEYKELQKTFVLITINNINFNIEIENDNITNINDTMYDKNNNITDGKIYKIEILGATMGIYNFNQFVDFLLPCDALHYYNLYEKLLCEDITQINADFVAEFVSEPLPFYTVPNLSLVKPYTTLPADISYYDTKPQTNAIIFDWNSKNVPSKPNIAYKNEMKQKEEYDFVINFLQKAFDTQKICNKTNSKISYKNFCEYYKKNYSNKSVNKKEIITQNLINDSNKQQIVRSDTHKEGNTTTCKTQKKRSKMISKHVYFSYLPLVSYYTLKGPWSRCWIKYGYDPREDYQNYVYQRLSKYKFAGLVNFVNEDNTIYSILKQNERKYVTKKYTKENGFFRKEFIDFLEKYCKKKNIEKVTQKQESDESCFNIL